MLPNYNREIYQIEEDILSDKIISGQLIKDCILRHRKDLENGHERGLHFDTDIAQDVLDFAEGLNGYNGLPAKLFWQQKIELYYFFGWRKGQNRRFKMMYLSMPRKNQKTITRPPKILYHIFEENEFAPEVYISATKEEQAKICFDDIVKIINYNDDLSEFFKVTSTTISNQEIQCKIRFLTSNPKTADGTRPSYYIIDEYHEFDDDGMLAKLRTGAINRDNSIADIITTRGTDKSKPCFVREQKVFIPVLKGIENDDSVFVMIFSSDEGDDIEDEKTWFKANPNLGVTISLDTFRQEFNLAKLQGQEALNAFKTLNLNMWVDAPKTVIKDEEWMACAAKVKLQDYYGKSCIGGFDMGLKDDFASFCLVFNDNERSDFENDLEYEKHARFTAFWWFWITSDSIQKRVSKGLHSVRDWVNHGYISVCEGNYNSYTQIQSEILKIANNFNIKFIGFDPAYIGSLAEGFQMNGIEPVEIPQKAWMPEKRFVNEKEITYNKGLSAVKQWFKELVFDKRLRHNGNPVMRWMVQNIVQTTDVNGNIWFTKDEKKRRDKIDGVSAKVNALSVIRNYTDTTVEAEFW